LSIKSKYRILNAFYVNENPEGQREKGKEKRGKGKEASSFISEECVCCIYVTLNPWHSRRAGAST